MKAVLSLGAFLLCWCLSAEVKAQEIDKWGLERCIEYALDNNLNVKQQVLNSEISKHSVTGAKGRMLPTLNGFANNVYNFGQTIDPFTNQFASSQVRSNNFSLSSNLTIFNGLQNYNNIKRRTYDYEASKYDVDKTRNDISLLIASSYLQVIFNQEILEVADKQVLITQQQVDRTEKLVNAGSLPPGNLYDVQAQLASEELSVVQATNNLNISVLQLKQLLQLDPGTPFSIERPELNIENQLSVEARPGQVYDVALSTLPDVKAAEMRVLSSEKAYQVAKGGMSPNLSVSGSYGTGYSGAARELVGGSVTPFTDTIGTTLTTQEPVINEAFDIQTEFATKSFNDQISDNLNRSIGFSLSIPILNYLSVRTNISQAKLNQELAQTNLEITKNQIRQDIETAYADAIAALNSYKATQRSLTALEESFKYAEQRFEVGLINAVEYNTAKNNLVRAQSDLVRAKFDFVFKSKVLDFYQGKPITLK